MFLACWSVCTIAQTFALACVRNYPQNRMLTTKADSAHPRTLARVRRTRRRSPERPTVTVLGKALFDSGQAPKDQSNRRRHMRGLRCLGNSSGDEADNPVIFSRIGL